MTNIDFENYFKTNGTQYYDAKIMITILEDIIGKPINEIKQDVNNKQITVTSWQIEDYLENKFFEENPELKKRISKPRNRRNTNVATWTKQDINDATQEFIDNLSVAKYHFEPYTLEYFNRYTTILRDKINLLLDIISKISIKDTVSLKETLTDLDIILDQNGDILREDIMRLILPIIYNIDELYGKVEQANDLSTYLTYKMSKHSLAKDGISENEIYPSKEIQIKDPYYSSINGTVPLSAHQKDELRKQEIEFVKKWLR